MNNHHSISLVSRIQNWYGGPMEYWTQIVDAYRDAEPFSDGLLVVGFDNEDALSAVLDSVTMDGEPVTASDAIEAWRLWDFLAAEFA